MISEHTQFGVIGEYWKPGKIMLDWDGTIPERATEISWVLGKLNVSINRLVTIPTKNGWHTIINTDGLELPPIAICAIQSILGSDFRRETFNLARALALHKRIPTPFELDRWNVLFKKKMEITPR